MSIFQTKGTQAFCNKCGTLYFTFLQDVYTYDIVSANHVEAAPGVNKIKDGEEMVCPECGQQLSVSRLIFKTPQARGNQ